MEIDIIIRHRNRLNYLKKTLKYIWERTNTPYRITIVDNGSNKRNVDYLLDLWKDNRIENIVLNKKNLGSYVALNQGFASTLSDLFVSISDDVLVPDIKPDWLERLLRVFDYMGDRLGMVAIKDPKNETGKILEEHYDDIICVESMDFYVGLINKHAYKILPWDDPDYKDEAAKMGDNMLPDYAIAYLKDVYCQHIGKTSALKGVYKDNKFDPNTFIDVDPKTLKPKEKNGVDK